MNKKISHIKKFIKNQKKLNSIHLSYITPRGKWYDGTWKAIKTKSGGIQTNIGIHLFDIVCQLFGKPVKIEKYILSPRKYSGKILFPNDVVMSFMLTINANELPKGYNSYRVLEINNKNFDLSKSFTNLHQESYKQIMLKKGFKIETYKKVFEFLN